MIYIFVPVSKPELILPPVFAVVRVDDWEGSSVIA
jgi:hypothetical protein